MVIAHNVNQISHLTEVNVNLQTIVYYMITIIYA